MGTIVNSSVGIIINERNHNDNDKIITILCSDGQVLKLLANSVRKYSNKNRSSTQLLTYCEIEYKINENRFSTIRSIKTINSYHELKLDYNILIYGMYFCEVINKLSFFNTLDSNVFNILIDALNNLTINNCKIIKLIFDLKIFKEFGVAPNLSSCTNCSNTNIFTISHQSGGYICQSCYNESMHKYSLKSLAMLKYLESLPFDYKQSVSISNTVQSEINEFIKLYYSYHLNIKINTSDYIN